MTFDIVALCREQPEGPERFRDGVTVAQPARVGQLSFSVTRRTNSAASASVISMCSMSL